MQRRARRIGAMRTANPVRLVRRWIGGNGAVAGLESSPDADASSEACPGSGGGHRMVKRWPERAGWDALAETMEVLAEACGAQAQCSEKYDHLRVELFGSARTEAQTRALAFMAELVEQLSDGEGAGHA